MVDNYKMLRFKENGKIIHIREHRKIMEEYLGRKLGINETVHHKNGNKRDNRIENLEIIERSKHSELYNKKVNKIKFNCSFCNKENCITEKRYNYRIKHSPNGNLYCSRKCFGLSKRR